MVAQADGSVRTRLHRPIAFNDQIWLGPSGSGSWIGTSGFSGGSIGSGCGAGSDGARSSRFGLSSSGMDSLLSQ